jgi:hypothetical protein
MKAHHCDLCGNQLPRGSRGYPVRQAVGFEEPDRDYGEACERCVGLIRDRARNGGSPLLPAQRVLQLS